MNMRAFDDGFQPLPAYADPRRALEAALPGLRPPEAVSVTEAAERYMRVNVGGQWKPFRRDAAPYMVEPTDTIASRAYRGLAFAGPSQSGKTLMLQSAVSYCITSDPARVALFQMTRGKAAEFEMDKLAPMIRNSPDLKRRLAKGRGADTQYQKLFSGGTHLTLGWPTIEQLSSSTIRWVLMTDYDHLGTSIGGEGDPYSLARNRPKTFRSRGMVVCESSPGASVTDETWAAQSIHDCPPVEYGILPLYADGTRGRWYWSCPHCASDFEPRFDLLHYPAGLGPSESGAAAVMVCPHNGCVIEPGLKPALNASGRWLHESSDGTRAVPLGDPDIRRSDMVSYWLNGAAAAFGTWAELVEARVKAEAQFRLTGDEERLKASYNTDCGEPYYQRSAAPENEIGLQALKEKAALLASPQGVCPAWTRYLIVSVDTQAKYFAVSVTAFGENGQHQPIDRFDLHTPPATAPHAATRSLDPFNVAEDWAILGPLLSRVWPVGGRDHGLSPVAAAVDMQGGATTTENAYGFYRARRKAGEASGWYLTRGSGGVHTDRVWLKAPESVSGLKHKAGRRRRKVAKDIEILNMATDRLKDAVAASLRLTEGQNVCHLASWMAEREALLVEYTAERRMKKGWEKRPGMQRNEMFDLLVQARAVNILIGGERVNWDRPPGWCADGAENANARPMAQTVAGAAAADDREPTLGLSAAATAQPDRPRRAKIMMRL